jgi:NTP pyrophosphatase (non-canonical NTP hydrolase)
MELKELLDFIDIENKRLRQQFKIDDEKMVLAQAVKMTEEVGELCSEILSHKNLQRSKKLENHDKENIKEEFADTVITTLLLAKSMDVDIEKALESKIEKINKRHEHRFI